MTTAFIVNDKGWPVIDKDPESVLDYIVDWVDWLPVGDSISSHTVTGKGITVDSDSTATTKVTAWLSGGKVGETPHAIFKIITTLGRTVERSLYFHIIQR